MNYTSETTSVFVRQGNKLGSVEHYFHFLFGYLIPFLDNVPKGDGNRYLFRDCGPVMNPILKNLPGYNTGFLGSDKPIGVTCFVGYDSPEFPGMDMESSRERVMDVFGVTQTPADGRILVVDRAEPHKFYAKDAEITQSGSSRRSVPNMKDVFAEIAMHFPADLVHLEGMGLREQILLFASRKVIVLQHGAAMSNLLFSRRGSLVLEIRSDSVQDYFAVMKSRMGIRCGRFVQNHDHAEVDPKEVVRLLKTLMMSSLKMI